jgi:release factor glutamine methyltransferase
MRELKAAILAILVSSRASRSPDAEVERILLHVLSERLPELDSFGKLYLLDPAPTATERNRCLELARSRAEGIPLQHLLGQQTFLEHDYAVNGSTLIPRPETEILVASCEEWVLARGTERPLRFAELGLGSGVISCELLFRFAKATGVASETSPAAIRLAESNLTRWCGPAWSGRLKVLEVSIEVAFAPFVAEAPFDLVISNPPYVSHEDEIEDEVLIHEPAGALFPFNGDPDYFYKDFISRAGTLLAPGGAAFFEIPHERADRLEAEFQKCGTKRISLIPDLTGRPRVLRAEF